MARLKRDRITDEDVEKALEAGPRSAVQQAAVVHRELAIDTLADCMKDGESPWSSKVSAANSMLAYSDGRPSVNRQTGNTNAGITINIMKLSDGTQEQVVLDVQPATDELDDAVALLAEES